MRKILNKGHRIRASDKNLVYRFCAGTLLSLFIAVLLPLNVGQLMRTDWEHFSLLDNGLTLSTYNFITVLIATGVCALVAFLYYHFRYDSFKKLLHRQKLARCRTAVFSLTCPLADQGKKSSGFRKSITRWTRDCSISAVKSRLASIKTRY